MPNIASRAPSPNLTDPVKGPSSAQIKLVAFSDFQCPYCRDWADIVKQLSDKYGSLIQIIWKDFPNASAHPEARNAAIAARCAQQQFKFWEYHDALYAHQESLGSALYVDIAKELGLNEASFTECVEKELTAGLVDGNSLEAVQFGVSATPTIFIGRYVMNEVPSYGRIDSLIDLLLRE
jgi:protein-disulfide isomerase